MLKTRVDPRVLGYLGRALSLEFSAVQLYSTQSRLVAYWGLASAAERLRHEAEEELQHTDRIIERMLALGVAPNASQLRPVKLGENLVDMLKINQHFEQELIDLYHAAATYSARIGDNDSRLFFHALFDEERRHHKELLAWQAELSDGEIGD
ncbi:MAG: ferritin-like domain-containing protein [Gammaproteobacteria bacterium]|nr:ferritin-like domain-containing protein [Gammaproteobacteria bacterium]